MPDKIVQLHTHSDYSTLDGCGKVGEYVELAKNRGHLAITLTEHGSMRSYYPLLLACKKHEIKPIYGIEFYMCQDMKKRGATQEEKEALLKGKKLNASESKALVRKYEGTRGLRAGWHLCAWAETMEGLKNLFKLSTISWKEGFYYRPRIDLEALVKHSNGVRIGTACTSGVLNALNFVGRRKKALEVADRMFEVFGDRMWFEIMPHDFEEQRVANKFTIELSERYPECKLITTNDSHYILSDDWKNHEVLLAIGTNDKMSNPDRFKFSGDGFHFRTRDEMKQAFQEKHDYISDELVEQALDNTMLFAQGCEVEIKIDRFACLMPELSIPEQFGHDEFAYLVDLCKKGWKWRNIKRRAQNVAERSGQTFEEVRQQYVHRLKKELDALKRQKFVGYMLLVHDIYRFARERKIACGPGRGSAAGCMVSFLIGITSTDPIEHGLIFERFINENRIDMPDIDMDFEDVRRQEIFDYLREKYGEDRVCQIATIGKLTGKQCLKDVSRVLDVPFHEVNQVTNSIIERSSGDERASQTIEDSFKDFKVCREFDKKYPDVLKYAKRIEGMAKNLGIHAAGVVVSPVPLTELIPLEVRNPGTNPVLVSAVDMYGCQDAGLLKLDVLGLRTMAVIRQATEAIGEQLGEDVDLEDLELNDPEVLEMFTKHDYVGIFQYDSPGADKICSGVDFTSFEDVAAMTALNRPGTARSGLATQYVARKKNPKLVEKVELHPKVNEITSDTLGIIVYQEHVIKIFTEIAGFAPSTADSLRKVIAKKWGDDTLAQQKVKFVEGAMNNPNLTGMTESIAAKIIDTVTFFGCLPGSCELKMFGERSKRIDEVEIGDELCSWDRSKKEIVANKIKNTKSTGIKSVFTIKCDNVSMEASKDHWWMMEDGSWKKTSQLLAGDKLFKVGEVCNEEHVQRGFSRVISVEFSRQIETWDLECEKEPHNYLLKNGVIAHNSYGFNKSHATAYGIIAYWGMWLKKNYPLQFYWALLKNEPNRIRVQQFAKAAKKQGIEILSPDVNNSKVGFSIDVERGAIRGSMVDIKNVGDKAAQTIMENQPFSSFCDMVQRIDKRRCNKRVISSLAKAGAMDVLIFNRRRFVEDIESEHGSIWSNVTKQRWDAIEEWLEIGKKKSDWSDDEKNMVASKVSPLAFGKHPVDAYGTFVSEHIGVSISNMSHEDFFKDNNNKGCFILGVIVEVKYNQIGDFHTGAPPTESEQLRMGWGKRYANINVEDVGGKQNRIKVDFDIFDEFRPIVDAGVGTPIVLHAVPNARYESMRAQFLVNLEEYRKKIIKDEPLNVWEKLIKGEHPVLTRKWKSKAQRRLALTRYLDVQSQADKGGRKKTSKLFRVTGIITNVKTKFDKNLNEMAFFGLLGVEGFADAMCFATSWQDYVDYIKPGVLISVTLLRERGSNQLHSEYGQLVVLEY